MKKCPQCERMLPDEAQQCSYCGAQLSTNGHQANKTPSNKVLYAIIGVLSALLIGGAILWYLTKDKPSPSTEPAVEQITQAQEAETGTAVQEGQARQDAGQKEGLVDDEGPVADEDDPGCTIGKVIVTGTDVRLRTTPEINNKNILKDKNGKNLHPKKGQILECIDAEGDFYYVYFNDMPCYISKQFTKIVE